METSIVVAGFGGQGVLFAGKLLAYAAMDYGYQVTWIPSYGPEMRGGTANCTVIMSDNPIGAPIVARPDNVIVLNQPSFDKYVSLVKPNGILVVNSDIVEATAVSPEITRVDIPASTVAQEVGQAKYLNVVAVGAFLGKTAVLPLTAVEKALRAQIPTHKADLFEINLDLLRRGYQLVNASTVSI